MANEGRGTGHTVRLARSVGEVALGAAGVAVVSVVLLPFRSHMSIATSGLVLVLPVVAAVAAAGLSAGVAAVIAGFAAFDLLFIPPYGRLTVGATQNWVALVVYALVMAVVARILAGLRAARADARRREEHARELLELSDVLIGDRRTTELLDVIVSTLQRALSLRSVALLLPADPPRPGLAQPEPEPLAVVAFAGEPLDAEQIRSVSPVGGQTRSIGAAAPGSDGLTWLPLAAAGRPIGVLAIAGNLPGAPDRELLRTYANHAALALERARLREQAVRSQVAEEADRWRQALLGAVSHDLRTPLSTVKAALSDLRRDDLGLTREHELELLELAETQSDRLERLVANLLDMTRIEAGAMRLRPGAAMLDELVADALAVLGPSWPGRLATSIPLTLPSVHVDRPLIVQVLANLLDNAVRHAPTESAINLVASSRAGFVEVAVEDRGPGVAVDERERIFEMFNRVLGGGRAGLGLTIAKTFVEVNGGTIRVEDRPGGGARFVFSLPIATASTEQRATKDRSV